MNQIAFVSRVLVTHRGHYRSGESGKTGTWIPWIRSCPFRVICYYCLCVCEGWPIAWQVQNWCCLEMTCTWQKCLPKIALWLGPTFPQSHVHVLQQLKTRDKLGSPGNGEVAQHIPSPPSWAWWTLLRFESPYWFVCIDLSALALIYTNLYTHPCWCVLFTHTHTHTCAYILYIHTD